MSSRALRWRLLGIAAVELGCGARGEAQGEGQVRELASTLLPAVERAVGLRYRVPPAIALRRPEQVRAYLVAKLDADYPPEELDRIVAAYRLFGLLPDTLDLRALLVALYTEQVMGYYDPDSSTLYVVEGVPTEALRLTLAHELVHALQGQYVALDSLLGIERNNDRRMAAQAVMEGQATLASLRVLLRDGDLDRLPELWREYRETVRLQQAQMPIFSRAPLVIREGLIFPYLGGADFVRWFAARFPDTVPYGPRLPESTEQILHPDRYAEGDGPVELGFPDYDGLLYDDNLGEFETAILLTVLSGSETVGTAGAMGWAGDRYGLFAAGGGGYALVWWSVWDSEEAARRIATVLEGEWASERPMRDRRVTVIQTRVDDRFAVRLVGAPVGWEGWNRVPLVIVK